MNEQKQIEQFIDNCREKNLSVTPQRLAIFKALVNDSSHPNPETIHKKIKVENPTISFATVYKTLETFEKHGIISLVTNLHNTVRYDPVTVQHHHIVCVHCKKVIDLFDEKLNHITIPKEVLKANNLVNFSVHFNVICPDCKNS
jgi:Fur family peroxide stress response transcriptional regulator